MSESAGCSLMVAPISPMPDPGDPCPGFVASVAGAGGWSTAASCRRRTAAYALMDRALVLAEGLLLVAGVGLSRTTLLEGLTGLREFGRRSK